MFVAYPTADRDCLRRKLLEIALIKIAVTVLEDIDLLRLFPFTTVASIMVRGNRTETLGAYDDPHIA